MKSLVYEIMPHSSLQASTFQISTLMSPPKITTGAKPNREKDKEHFFCFGLFRFTSYKEAKGNYSVNKDKNSGAKV